MSDLPCRRLAVMAVLALTLMLSGCAGLFGPSEPKAPPEVVPREIKDARAAWEAGRFAVSFPIYRQAASLPGISQKLLAECLERSAKGAVYSGDYKSARTALSEWAERLPEARKSWVWHHLNTQVIAKLDGEAKAREYLAGLMLREGVPYSVSSQAALELARRQMLRGENSRALQIIRDVYERAPADADRAALEEQFARVVSGLTRPVFDKVAARVNAGNHLAFPYVLIDFENALRQAEGHPEKNAGLDKLAKELAATAELADKGLPARLLAERQKAAPAREQAKPEEVAPGSLSVAMILPRGGALKSVGDKVARGAETAREALTKAGVNVDIRFIDASDPGWFETLSSLPKEVVLVGGPMQIEMFKKISESNVTAERAFFTFLPSLGETAREGVTAWRFFGGPRDEVYALARFAADYEQKELAVLAPQDRFGSRMAELMQAEAAVAGLSLVKTAAYPPKDASKWDEVVKSMLEGGKPPFSAIFIPDDFSRADGLIPYLFYNEMSSLLILGPRLWSEALSQPAARQMRLNANYYRLAVCPGAWQQDNPAPAAEALRQALGQAGPDQADFWTALGYDFVRFAAKLGPVKPGFAPEEINHRLSSLADMEYSIAPLSWDAAGQARQALFMFRPSAQGLTPVDKEGFRERLKTIRGEAESGQGERPGEQRPVPEGVRP